MQQTALNLMAIGIFTMTIFSMLGPILHISPLVPAVTTVGLLGVLGLDTLQWQNRGMSILLEQVAGKKHRQRIIHHEAGHFLIAYLLGIPILDYSLSALEAWRKGQPGSGGVLLDTENLKNTEELTLEKISTVWMAGIAAEQMVYSEAEGGSEDRQQFYVTLQRRGLNKNTYPSKEHFALKDAKNLLLEHQFAYKTLVDLMGKGTAVKECYQALNLLKQQN